ncbi:hypothetical protein ABZS68_20115 [Streptomyces sp. NPDC005571]|uniref:hypothetical protein n=1 Tax=Streptomyces sp. NPDC005571 TaxID=3156888 RepID=UPI0033A95BE7
MEQTGPFVVHTAADSYTRDLRDPTLVPMLGVDDNRLAALASLMGAPTGRKDPDVSGTLVVAPADSMATAVGRALADRVDGSFVTLPTSGLGQILDARLEATQVVFIALHDEIDLDVVTESLEAVGAFRHDGGHATIGFVIGPDLPELSWMLAKGLSCHLRKPPERSQLTVVPWLRQHAAASRTPASDDADAAPEWVIGDRASRAVLEPMLFERHTGLVSFASAGREHALILNDTVICGDHAGHKRPSTHSAATPSCAFSDRCFRDGVRARDVIKAARVHADIVFANSCMAWRPGTGLVAAEYQLAGAFQYGIPAAYIGAIHQMLPNLTINDLVGTATAAGTDAGRTCAAINDHLRDTGRELPYFALLGLPWVTAGAGSEPSTTDAEPSAGAHDGVRDPKPKLLRLGRTVRAFREFEPTGFMPPDGIVAMEAEILELARTLKKTVLGAEPAERAFGPLSRLDSVIADAELSAVTDFHEFGKLSHSALNEMWEGILDTRVRPIDEACPYCTGRLAELAGRHPVYEQVGRRMLVCNVCGPIADSPLEPVISKVLIDCPSIWKRPGTVTVDALMTPAASVSQEIIVAGAIHTSGAANYGVAFPDAQRIAIRPGAPTRLRVSATLSAEAFTHHEHFVRFIAVAEGRVHYASRPVAVAPAATAPFLAQSAISRRLALQSLPRDLRSFS